MVARMDKDKREEWYWFNKTIDDIIGITIFFGFWFGVIIFIVLVMFGRGEYISSLIFGMVFTIMVVAYVCIINEKKKEFKIPTTRRSEHVGDGQRRNAGSGEEEGKKGHNSRI